MVRGIRVAATLSLLSGAALWAVQSDDAPARRVDPKARVEYFRDQRSFPNGVPEGARLKAYKQLKAMEDAARSGAVPRSAAADGQWHLIGPQPTQASPILTTSGRIEAVAVDPRDNNVVYIGAADGGIWKTTDGGTTWKPLTDDQPSLAMGAIALDPANPNIVYAGTGEESFSGDAYTGAGILKSTDGGATWTNIPGPFVRSSISAIAVHPSDGKTVLAASRLGLYRSTDAGQTWTPVMASSATAVAFDPFRTGVAWAGIGSSVGAAANGVYKSSDNGATWTRVSGAAGSALPTGTGLARIALAPSPITPDTLYVAAAEGADGNDLAGVYRTSDAGLHWTWTGAPDFCTPQCWYDLVVTPSPAAPNVIYFGGIGLVRTLDAGTTWQTLTTEDTPTQHPDQHALQFTPDGKRLYVGNDGGAWSTDNPSGSAIPTWTSLNGALSITQFYPGVSIHPTNASDAIAGSQDNGTQHYSGALKWNQQVGGDGGYTALDPSSPSIRYASQPSGILVRTTNGAFTDTIAVMGGIDPNDRVRFIAPYIMDPSNPVTMYMGTDHLYRSIDGGGQWTAISPDLTKPPSASTTSTVYAISTIAVAPTNPSVLYTGAPSGALFASLDGGMTWLDRTGKIPTRGVSHLTVDPFDAMTVYATFSGYAATTETYQGHVFKSSDGGATWSDIGKSLPNLPIDDLVVDPDIPGTLYIGTDLGVMVSPDSGATWTTLGNGLPKTAVLGLVLHRSSRTLRAATHGRSVWDYALPAATPGTWPNITSLTPATANAGGTAFDLTITGTGFTPNSHVWWNGQERTVTTGSNTSLTVHLPASDIANVGRAAVIVFNAASGGGASLPVSFNIGPAPLIGTGGIVSAADPKASPVAAPGAIMSLYGVNLAGSIAQAETYPLPGTLGQVVVTINGVTMPLYFVSPSQINFQVPTGVLAGRSYNIAVAQGAFTSNVATLVGATVAPAIFSTNQGGTGQGAVLIANSTSIPAPTGTFPGSRPVKAGEAIQIYCTGLGAVSPNSVAGEAAPSSPLARTLLTPTATVGGVNAQVLFSGLAPGFSGLYQVNVAVPSGVASADGVPVVLNIGGVPSNTVTIAVGQ